MIEPLRWNTLEETADWLTKRTGETWTPRRVLDFGEQGVISVRAVLPPNIQLSIGGESTWVGNTIKLDGVYLDCLLKRENVYVSATCDVPMGRGSVEADIELTPPALITLDDLGVSGADLKAAGEAFAGRGDQAVTLPLDAGKSRDVPGSAWQEEARGIADELYVRDAVMGCYDSLKNLCDRVADELRKRNIHAPLGPVLPGTVKREALQGAAWWQVRKQRNKQRIDDAKKAREAGGTGEL